LKCEWIGWDRSYSWGRGGGGGEGVRSKVEGFG
jgi:hypothetical protein